MLFRSGAMNDVSEKNGRWGERGRYMAGSEADTTAEAPEGWTKWIIPAQTYLVVGCSMASYGEIFDRITDDPDIHIAGTVHERYPEPGNPDVIELYIPVAAGMVFCQSCGMPMTQPEDFGTEKDGGPSVDYCRYCYGDGAFFKDETVEEMIETCIPFALEDGTYETEAEARAAMKEYYPTLKRWTKK